MYNLRRWTLCKALAVVLCVFFLMEAHALYAQQSAVQADQWEASFKTAKEAYFASNFINARTTLEKLLEDLSTVQGQDTLKGRAYLLAGATYEKLDQLGLSVKYYCQAKATLGEGKTIEGLVLKDCKYYKADCAAIGAILEAGLGNETDELVAQYNQAKIGYFAGAYEAARATLESLITSLGAIDGRDTFKGQVYLLTGANYEVLRFKELAVKYYCKAKAILGEGKTIEGLELKNLKDYKEPCGGAAVAAGAGTVAGPRRKSFFGGLIGALLGLALVGGVIWYLFFSKNAPLGKKGKYTSITFRLDVKYRGFNSQGHRKLTIGGEVRNDEDFNYPQNISGEVPCTDATKEENYSYTYQLTGDSVVMNQDWVNWDYFSFGAGENWKKICADYTITIDKYEYDGGRDPGEPSAEGLDQLKVSSTAQCTAKSLRVHDCFRTATITFKAPVAGVKFRGVTATSSEMSHKY
jgi:tetratricopeptide (TPR) repeat protein